MCAGTNIMFKKQRSKPPTIPAPSAAAANKNGDNNHHYENNNVLNKNQHAPVLPISKASLQFHCQLAHGSPTAFVSGFSNVRELYQKIAESFDFPASEVGDDNIIVAMGA